MFLELAVFIYKRIISYQMFSAFTFYWSNKDYAQNGNTTSYRYSLIELGDAM